MSPRVIVLSRNELDFLFELVNEFLNHKAFPKENEVFKDFVSLLHKKLVVYRLTLD